MEFGESRSSSRSLALFESIDSTRLDSNDTVDSWRDTVTERDEDGDGSDSDTISEEVEINGSSQHNIASSYHIASQFRYLYHLSFPRVADVGSWNLRSIRSDIKLTE